MTQAQTVGERSPTDEAHAAATLWDMSLDMMATANVNGYLVRVNPAWERTLGYSPAELTARPYLDFVHPDDVERTAAQAAALVEPGSLCVAFDNRYRGSDGRYHWLSWSCRAAPGGQAIYAVVRDVTAIREADADRDAMQVRLGEGERLLDGVLENAPIGMAVTALYGKILRSNRALREITGYSDAELRRLASLMTITHPDDGVAKDEDLRALSVSNVSRRRPDRRLVRSDGQVIWVESSTSLVCDAQGDPLHMIVQIQDISIRKDLEERMEHFASVDALTGMRNRRLFEEYLHTQVARCQRYGEEAALLILDLDDFKNINDTYGHKVGDDVLRAVSAALKKRVRSGDQAARLGGDEFGVLLSNVTLAQAEAVAVDLHRAVAGAEVTIGGEVVASRVSIGIGVIDERATDDDAILAAADSSMYAAKRAAHNASRRAVALGPEGR